jgi:hypothetical protein
MSVISRGIFAPCVVGDHAGCVGEANNLFRNGSLAVCQCPCHAPQKAAQKEATRRRREVRGWAYFLAFCTAFTLGGILLKLGTIFPPSYPVLREVFYEGLVALLVLIALAGATGYKVGQWKTTNPKNPSN